MEMVVSNTRPIVCDIETLNDWKPFELITLFEVAEHLSEGEFQEFLARSDTLLHPGGKILFSAPIEVGLGLLLKEFNRFILKFKRPEHRLVELLMAAFLGRAASRAADIKTSHKGYDFRRTVRELRQSGWKVTILAYGPLPLGTWYGNSQVYFCAVRQSNRGFPR